MKTVPLLKLRKQAFTLVEIPLVSYLVAPRQGWNLPYAVGALAGAGVLTAIVAGVARRPAWLRAGTVIGIAVAFVVWRLVPYQGWRLF